MNNNEIYNHLLDKYADLINTITWDNSSISTLYAIQYLLLSGIFSNKKFKYIEKDNDLKLRDGSNIILGFGSSFDISYFTTDLMNKLNQECYDFISLKTNSKLILQRSDIIYNFNKYAYMANFFYHNGQYYIFDMSTFKNMLYFTVKGKKVRINNYYNEYSNDLLYRFSLSTYFEMLAQNAMLIKEIYNEVRNKYNINNSFDNAKDLEKILCKQNPRLIKEEEKIHKRMKAVDLNENYLTLQEIELAFKETNNLINKNTSLINTFYSDIKKEKENFVKSIKR